MKMGRKPSPKETTFGTSRQRRNQREDGHSALSIAGWQERRTGLLTLVYDGLGHHGYGIHRLHGTTFRLLTRRQIFLRGCHGRMINYPVRLLPMQRVVILQLKPECVYAPRLVSSWINDGLRIVHTRRSRRGALSNCSCQYCSDVDTRYIVLPLS